MLEIKRHDGPARLGNYEGLITPAIFKPGVEFKIIKDEPMPYDVPKELAKWSVNQTIENAKKSKEKGIGVIHGGKYLDLRIKCAKELDDLGITTFLIANPKELMRQPWDLVDIIVSIRENINPNASLYFSFVDINFIPLLAYMGVDLFGDFSCDFYAYLNVMQTPTANYDITKYQIYNLDFEELKKYNKNTMDFVIKEIQENIKNMTLRNLVEERCCSSPESMSALRILDKKHADFLKKYMPLY
ncbi:archaeosine tRNA-ribosyltransferase [Methanobacterium sp.]|uniref:archaeosine tRNA-ribosyltransferase n=1 Tax=Methanobacterium sp. TaxID=2164 RepID=UPI003C73BD17